jgi:hypothetical protein
MDQGVGGVQPTSTTGKLQLSLIVILSVAKSSPQGWFDIQ